MAQKNKVKELVGRGLHSYHTKALQQVDRIEKKNKEQNHKISILSNELDNDYLTKTEEGSVISLEHSKEGMVYLDELQGNTLVNYCTDGSKEMTLNGDIDVEGVSVTTTEGVDNGKVDVMCEGNTLVNICGYGFKELNKYTQLSGTYLEDNSFVRFQMDANDKRAFRKIEHTPLKTSTKYTIFVEIKENTIINTGANHILYPISNTTDSAFKDIWGMSATDATIGIHKRVVTTRESFDGCTIGVRSYVRYIQGGSGYISYRLWLVEGEHLDSDIPYFEGMKSVGEDDENGHKIEILSRNKNLWNVNEYGLSTGIYAGVQITKLENGFKLNGTSTSSFTRHSSTNYLDIFEKGKTYILTSDYFNFEITYANGTKNWRKLVTVTDDVVKVTCYLQWLENIITFDNLILTPQIEEGSVATSYLAPSLNKKEILLNEPLRGLPNGVKDKKVKIGNKWYIERNCGEIILDGSEEDWVSILAFSKTNVFRKPLLVAKNTVTDYETVVNNFLVDKLPIVKYSTYDTTDAQTVSFSSLFNTSVYNGTAIYINRNSSSDLVSFKQWLSENPITVIYELATPIYEPLEVEPILNTYNDITHISNNSIIPCNMKIKNSGYNAIIKPSTLYTIALDTNKSGTIGMNLGGVKGTTTNNVLKLTTPATLTDDSLRLYGKGIKGSKVRLLEGDKTNWIPSFFEGMKSSFEDKLQDDGTYKMEILSNNKNLFNGTWVYDEKNNKINSSDLIKVKPNTTYTISDNLNYRYQIYEYSDKSTHFNSMYPYAGSYTFTTNKRTHYLRFSTYAPSTDVDVKFILEEGRNITLYEPNKSNKIQFSSIEPLRRVGNSKDRIVFINNKLMIERNTKQTILVGNPTEGWSEPSSHTTSNKCLLFSSKKTNELKTHSRIYSDRFMTPNETNAGDSSLWQIDREGIGHTIYNDVRIRIDRERLTTPNKAGFIKWLSENPTKIVCELAEPTYEEVPFELQKIILEGYENGTLFFDTNIPPTSTVTYAGETPIVKATKLNKTEVLNNTEDINDNIIPYLMDMDYRVVMLQLATEELEGGVSMARLFGGTYEMIKRDILSKRLTREEYGYRLADYFNAGKLTEEQVRELEELR